MLRKLVTPTSTQQLSILCLLITEVMDLTLTLIILMVILTVGAAVTGMSPKTWLSCQRIPS